MSKEKKCFIIGIGGTGMRCLETFTHMCAMGLYDGMEFNVLTLDTDFTNGNKNVLITKLSSNSEFVRWFSNLFKNSATSL